MYISFFLSSIFRCSMSPIFPEKHQESLPELKSAANLYKFSETGNFFVFFMIVGHTPSETQKNLLGKKIIAVR